MPNLEPIFVLSCERAGSTLLRYVIDAHPEVCSPGELALGQLISRLRLVVGSTLAVDAKSSAEREALKSAEARAAVDGIMQRYARAKGKSIWCDKTPGVRHVAELIATYPRARYVLLHRHCLDVVFSCLEISRTGFIGTLPEYVAKNPGNIVAALTESWCDKTEAMVELEEQRKVATHRITYEDLVMKSESTARALFDFLELPMPPGLLDEVFRVPHDEGLGDPKIRYTSRIETGSIGRGATLMAGKQSLHAALSGRANRVLSHLGYPQLSQWGQPQTGAAGRGRVREVLLALPQRLSAGAVPASQHHRYRIVVTGADPATYLVDLTSSAAPRVSLEDGPSDFTVIVPSDVLESVIDGRLNPAVGFMQGSIAGQAHCDAPPFHAVRVLKLLMP